MMTVTRCTSPLLATMLASALMFSAFPQRAFARAERAGPRSDAGKCPGAGRQSGARGRGYSG